MKGIGYKINSQLKTLIAVIAKMSDNIPTEQLIKHVINKPRANGNSLSAVVKMSARGRYNMAPVDLNQLGPAGLKEFLDTFDHVFSDCDGVIWIGNPLPGSGEFFKRIKEHGKTVHFVSNNSMRTKEDYEKKFKLSGIENGFENLTIPSLAIADYLKSVKFDKKVYCIACPETKRVLELNGFKCEEGPDVGASFYQEYFQYLKDDTEIGAVVFDSDFKVNLPKLYRALTYLRRPEVLFISGATDRYVTFKPGYLALGTGVFTDLAVDESGRIPIQLGKPGREFGVFAMKRAGYTDPSRVLFIGDMIEQDIGLGKSMGFKTLLVLTNNSKESMLAHEKIQPDFYAESLGSLVSQLKINMHS